jgi:hypothetical protein
MKGYIGVTTKEWFTYLSNNKDMQEVNFWRKDVRNFNSLTKGDPFFFLVSKRKEK